jgi:hypothetical protein
MSKHRRVLVGEMFFTTCLSRSKSAYISFHHKSGMLMRVR